MNEQDRVRLQQMIQHNNVEDQTEIIRKVKHSELIKCDVVRYNVLCETHKELRNQDLDEFHRVCERECNFLYTNYTDIFHKLKNNTLNQTIFGEFLKVLALIENGSLDQHEASFQICTLLKKLYVDSALQQSSQLDAQYAEAPKNQGSQLSWAAFKKQL